MRNIKLLIIFGFVVTCYMLSTTWTQAQQISLSVSPPLLETVIKPGKSILIAYTLTNFGDPAILKTYALPFEARDIRGNISVKSEFEGPIQFGLDNANIQMNQPYFLKSQASQQLLLRIRVPEGAPEGDYYYTLLSETEPPPTLEGRMGSRARASIGSNILITVTESGKVDLQGKISLFDVLTHNKISFFGRSFKIFDSGDVVPVVLRVQNRGKNFFKPEGTIELRGNFGEKATYSILPQNVLSQSERLLTATPSASIDCDEKKNSKTCSSSHSLLLSGFFLGSYKLSTTVNFGEGTPNLYASASFIALPLRLLIGLIVAIGVISLLILKFRKSSSN